MSVRKGSAWPWAVTRKKAPRFSWTGSRRISVFSCFRMTWIPCCPIWNKLRSGCPTWKSPASRMSSTDRCPIRRTICRRWARPSDSGISGWPKAIPSVSPWRGVSAGRWPNGLSRANRVLTCGRVIRAVTANSPPANTPPSRPRKPTSTPTCCRSLKKNCRRVGRSRPVRFTICWRPAALSSVPFTVGSVPTGSRRTVSSRGITVLSSVPIISTMSVRNAAGCEAAPVSPISATLPGFRFPAPVPHRCWKKYCARGCRMKGGRPPVMR